MIIRPSIKKSGLFRKIRIAILASILCVVAVNTWLQKRDATDWKEPINVGIYPIVGQDSATVADYVASLQAAQFNPISAYFAQEAEAWDLSLPQPFAFHLGPEIKSMPPVLPQSHNVINIIWWSLKARYWSYRNSPAIHPKPDIKIYAIYYKSRKGDLRENSLGLQKGLIGIVHIYADPLIEPRNNIILAHEILHTLGATDKYDLQTSQPIFPDGFADPDQKPLYPQGLAEIMAGRIPLSPTKAAMPQDLDHCVINYETALEIKWIDE